MKFFKWLKCNVLKDHNWTTANEQGIDPTQEQKDRGIDGFMEYSQMYCKDCGHLCKLSEGWRNG